MGIDDIKGNIKEGVGKVTGDESLETEGKVDQAKAAIKDAAENVKDAAGDAVDAVKDKLS